MFPANGFRHSCNLGVLVAGAAWLLCSMSSTPAQAADAAAKKSPQWMVGVGVAAVPDYEGSGDYELRPAGVGKLSWASGRFIDAAGSRGAGAAPRFRANLAKSGGLVWGPVLQIRRKRGDVENKKVKNLPSVDAALEVGGFAGLRSGNLGIDMTITGAATQYRGWQIELSPEYKKKINDNFTLTFMGASTWMSDGYADRYFTVTPAQSAVSGLAPYKSKSGLKDVGAGVSMSYRPTGWEHWSFAGAFRYARLILNADDSSPIVAVGSENQFYSGVMVIYNN